MFEMVNVMSIMTNNFEERIMKGVEVCIIHLLAELYNLKIYSNESYDPTQPFIIIFFSLRITVIQVGES